MATVTEPLLTAEQYRLLPDTGRPTELVRGRVVELDIPTPRHGYCCANVIQELGNFIEVRRLGRMTALSGVITERNPDTVRGADVCYYSYGRLPKQPLPEGYLDVVPELVFEVRSPRDTWPQMLRKAGEYLDASVEVVCVLDPQGETLTVCRQDSPPRVLSIDDELTLPELFGGEFRVPVRRFFE